MQQSVARSDDVLFTILFNKHVFVVTIGTTTTTTTAVAVDDKCDSNLLFTKCTCCSIQPSSEFTNLLLCTVSHTSLMNIQCSTNS